METLISHVILNRGKVALNKNKVKYLLLGGWAAGIKGMIRYGFRTTSSAIAA